MTPAPARLVAVHQPNFLPWLGYFDKIARADVFVILDNVQFMKTGGNWANRVRMLVNGEPRWVTVPVDRAYSGYRRIAEMRTAGHEDWRRKIRRTIELSYRRAPHFGVVYKALEPLLLDPCELLGNYNVRGIVALTDQLGIASPKLVRASELQAGGQATDLLIELVRAVDGDAYLAGAGAAGYQEDEKFEAAGIRLVYQSFQHPRYPQFNRTDFVPGLSIVDVLMNVGFAGTSRLLGVTG